MGVGGWAALWDYSSWEIRVFVFYIFFPSRACLRAVGIRGPVCVVVREYKHRMPSSMTCCGCPFARRSCEGPTDVAGTCCGDEGILTPAGFCCSSINVTDPVTNATRRSHPRLDRNGTCCASGRLNACGVCDGVRTAVVAASGECCVGGVLDAGGLCCVSDVLDAFGVCDGTDSTGTQVRGLALVAVLCPFFFFFLFHRFHSISFTRAQGIPK
jgi:hypothetical protein